MSIPGGSGIPSGKLGKLPSNFSRAYDLSSLARPQGSPAKSGDSGSRGASSALNEVTEANIVTDFIEYSNRHPVVIFVWSERAKGSHEMLALLAKLAGEDGGKWKLGAFSFDKSPELAQALRITAIPAAIAFIQEKALPIPQLPPEEASLRLVVNKIMELATQQGMTLTDSNEAQQSVQNSAEPEEEEAYQAIERGDFQSAAQSFRRLIERKPSDTMAKQGLAQCELMIRTEGINPAEALKRADENPTDFEAIKLAADIEIASGNFAQGFSRLIAFIKANPGDIRKVAKEHLFSLFLVVPADDPVLIKARRDLASALF
ncbi:MAG: co-chaperone YbbN [Candidatus Nanopelagicaceae bacterium]